MRAHQLVLPETGALISQRALRDVLPGDYYLVAVRDGVWPVDDDALRALVASSVRVHVTPDQPVTQTLTTVR